MIVGLILAVQTQGAGSSPPSHTYCTHALTAPACPGFVLVSFLVCTRETIDFLFAVIPILTYVLLYPLAMHIGIPLYDPYPSFLETVKHMAVFIVCEDFLFYWTHRLLHTPWLYARIHKVRFHCFIHPV